MSEENTRSPLADPLAFIREKVRKRRVLWTHHVNMRMKGRFISRAAILDAVDHFELVEAYPEDKYLPSFLVLGRKEREAFHVLFAVDVVADNVRVVTAYRPDPEEWMPDLKTRRSQR